MTGDSIVETPQTERLIAFIDILGFRSVLAGTSHQASILDVLREVAEQDRNFEVKVKTVSARERTISIMPAFTSFSDNILVSFDLQKLAPVGVWHPLMLIRSTVSSVAHRARQFGCLVRGAVTVGPLYHHDRVAFGKGLVDAYLLESSTAFYPRVIVTDSVFQHMPGFASADGSSTDDRAMFRDADGFWCLDYMTAYLDTMGSEISANACTARRAWALTTRADARQKGEELAAAGKYRPAQNWRWFADRFAKSMLSVSPHRFNMDGQALVFPE
jgi:hypothetical protein